MKTWNIIGMLCCLLGTPSCTKPDRETMSAPQQTNYYFEMDAAKQTKFKSALHDLKIGSSHQTIVAALGKPDYDRTLATKDGKFVARSLIFYFKRWKKDWVSEGKDQRVDFWLDSNDNLWRINSDVNGIPNLGKDGP